MIRGSLWGIVTFVGVVGVLVACDKAASTPDTLPDPTALTERARQFEKKLAAPDSEAKLGGAVARWVMPDKLKEISGLALTEDGRLLGHGDEHAHVFEIDYRRGVIVKEFTLVSGRAANLRS